MSESPFAALVRRRLQERGLGLREFCRSVSVDPSFFSKVLAGKRSPPSEDDVLRRIAKALELDPRELILAAGRLPSEWSRLTSDPRLVDAVHRLCTDGHSAAWNRQPAVRSPLPPPAGEGRVRAKPSSPLPAPAPSRLNPPRTFGDELL